MSARTISLPLSTGHQLFVEPDARIPLVTFNITFPGGYAHDPHGKDGLSRLVGRVLRRGVDGLTANEFEAAIDGLGAEFAFDISASATQLQGQVIARNADAFIDLLARMFARLTAPDAEIQKTIREAVSELSEARDNDRVLLHRAFRGALFHGHGYARSALGDETTLGAITPADVRDFAKRRFVRDGATLGFAGAITAEAAVRLAEHLLAALGTTPAISATLPPPSVPKAGRHLLFVDKPERTQTQLQIGRLGTSPHDPDHAALLLGNSIFGGSFTSRMMQEIRVKRGWSYGAGSRLPIDRERHEFSMHCATASEDAAACIALQIGMLEKLVAEGVTDRETAATKKFLVKSWAFEVDTAEKRLVHPLDVVALALPEDYYSGYTARFAATSREAANAAIARRLPADDLMICVVGTAGDVLEGLQKAIPNLASTTVIPYTAA